MMDRNQIWFHGTAAGAIYLLKDLFKSQVQKNVLMWCFENLPCQNTCHQMAIREGVKWVQKEAGNLVAKLD